MDEWLAIGIWELVQDAKHNPRHMALAQELKRLYAVAGEPTTVLLEGIPDAPRAGDAWPGDTLLRITAVTVTNTDGTVIEMTPCGGADVPNS